MVPPGHLPKSQSLQNFPPEQLEKLNTILLSLALPTLCAPSACGPWSVLKENKLIGAAVPWWPWTGPPRAWGYLLSCYPGKIAKAPAGRWFWGYLEGSYSVITFCLIFGLVMFRGCPYSGGGWPLRGRGVVSTLIPGSLWAVVDAMNLWCFALRPSVCDSHCSSVVTVFMSRGAGKSQRWEGKGWGEYTWQLIISLLKWG